MLYSLIVLVAAKQLEDIQMSNEPEKWSSLEEIAEHLGVSKDTIRNWIKKGVIPYRRIGKQYKFKISEVDAWVDSGKSAEIE
jgi:excisionase family DNA binding protein